MIFMLLGGQVGLQLQHCTSGGGAHHPQPQQVMRRLHQWKHPLEKALEMRSQQPGLEQQHQHVQHAVHMHQNMTCTICVTRIPTARIHFKKCSPEFCLSRTLQYSSAAAPVAKRHPVGANWIAALPWEHTAF